VLAAALVDDDGHALLRAALGWAVVGGFYLVMWLVYPRGIGYGDVRLSGLLGIALGYLGWAETIVGGYAGLLVGALGGVVLVRLRRADRKHVPYGPFMVAGAVLGVLVGPAIAAGLGY
jgi:leader peptidase (prepilin peptidase)/N-methyltransferase